MFGPWAFVFEALDAPNNPPVLLDAPNMPPVLEEPNNPPVEGLFNGFVEAPKSPPVVAVELEFPNNPPAAVEFELPVAVVLGLPNKPPVFAVELELPNKPPVAGLLLLPNKPPEVFEVPVLEVGFEALVPNKPPPVVEEDEFVFPNKPPPAAADDEFVFPNNPPVVGLDPVLPNKPPLLLVLFAEEPNKPEEVRPGNAVSALFEEFPNKPVLAFCCVFAGRDAPCDLAPKVGNAEEEFPKSPPEIGCAPPEFEVLAPKPVEFPQLVPALIMDPMDCFFFRFFFLFYI